MKRDWLGDSRVCLSVGFLEFFFRGKMNGLVGFDVEWRDLGLLFRVELYWLIVLFRADIELVVLIYRGVWFRVVVISIIRLFSYWIMGSGYLWLSLFILLGFFFSWFGFWVLFRKKI